MSKLEEMLPKKEAWSELIMGNYALARAMIEAKTRVVTTFPGSPTPEIAAALDSVDPARRDYYFEYSVNEKVALEVAAGASMNGHLSAVFFKSVGLNVAADSLIQLSMMELIGGMVIILGDDPGANSSQNEQDNRWFSRMSYIPMLEPATPTEAYRMYLEAARLSVEHRAPFFLRMTTHVCHAREVVHFGAIDAAATDWTPRFDAGNGPYVPIARTVFPLKRKALEKLHAFERSAIAGNLAPVIAANGDGGPAPRLGIVSSGLPAMAALEVIGETGAKVDVLKLLMTYPLPADALAGFLEAHDEVLVLEELDRVLETELKALAWERRASCRLFARTDPEDLMGELGPRRVAKILAETWPADFSFAAAADDAADEVPPRLPQMCPGCGHRSAFHAIAKALGENDITVADIGCHSLGYLPPYEMGEVLLSMGHGVSTASGMAIENRTRKVLTFIGDSTLFHAGLPGIVNAAVYDHDITLVLMENGTTAMTGHQPRFGSGEVGAKLPFVPLLEALGVKFIREVDTYEQARLTAAVREAMEHRGFAMVIARHPCMLKFTRDQRRRMPGFRMPNVRVDQDKCERLHECVAQFGCPSFTRHEDGHVTVSEDLCIGDGSCLQTCPVTALWRPRPGGER